MAYRWVPTGHLPVRVRKERPRLAQAPPREVTPLPSHHTVAEPGSVPRLNVEIPQANRSSGPDLHTDLTTHEQELAVHRVHVVDGAAGEKSLDSHCSVGEMFGRDHVPCESSLAEETVGSCSRLAERSCWQTGCCKRHGAWSREVHPDGEVIGAKTLDHE